MVDPAQQAEDANGAPTDAKRPAPTVEANGFPEQYIVFGVFVGLFLTLLGVGILSLGTLLALDGASPAAALTTCVGFGVILAAFGARASGSWAGWSAAGAGAMAVLLFLLLQRFSPGPEPDLMKGSLEGDFSKVADLRIIDDVPMYVYRDRGTSTINFLKLGKELRSHRVRVQVDTVERDEGREFFQMIGNATGIGRIREKRDGPILWTFDYANRRVLDGEDVIFSERGTISGTDNALNGGSSAPPWWKMAAFAGDLIAVDQAEIASALSDLVSDDTFVRRNARETLALAGPPAVAPLIQAWRADPDNYRIKLGASYAMTEMLQSDPDRRPAISAAIPTEDFPLLIAAASDPDKTIRFQAAEFLYLLEDPRSVELSIEAAKQAYDESMARNQILILRQAAQDLPTAEKGDIIEQLQAPAIDPGKALAKDGSLVRDVLKW